MQLHISPNLPGTTPRHLFLHALRQAIASGLARLREDFTVPDSPVITVEAPAHSLAAPVASAAADEPIEIGALYRDGVALHPARTVEAVTRWREQHGLSVLNTPPATVLKALQAAGDLCRWNNGRCDYQIRVGTARYRVWYIKPHSLGFLDPNAAASEDEKINCPVTPFAQDIFGSYIPSTSSGIDQRMIDALRLIGRLRIALPGHIHQMSYAGFSEGAVYRGIAYLIRKGLLTTVSNKHIEFVRAGPRDSQGGRKPRLLTLTRSGREWLTTHVHAEADERHAAALKVIPDPSDIFEVSSASRYLLRSWWLANALISLRRNRWFQGAYLETDFVVNEHQTLHAYLEIRLNTSRPREDPWQVWVANDPAAPDDTVVRLALEFDQGLEPPLVVHLKAHTTAQLTYKSAYEWLYAGFVMPVWIVPTVARKAEVMNEFASIWPGTWGIIATTYDCHDPIGGVLWGNYHRMNKMDPELPPEELLPLTQLYRTPDNKVAWRPAITIRQWKEGLISVPPVPSLPPPREGLRYGRKSKW